MNSLRGSIILFALLVLFLAHYSISTTTTSFENNDLEVINATIQRRNFLARLNNDDSKKNSPSHFRAHYDEYRQQKKKKNKNKNYRAAHQQEEEEEERSHFKQESSSSSSSSSSVGSSNRRGTFESGIVRTSGSLCKQTSSSSVSCDMCCEGKCCEDTANMNNPQTTLSGYQTWIPLKFAFIVKDTYTTSNLPSTATQENLVGKINEAFAQSPFRVVHSGHTVHKNSTLHSHCVTDPCYASATCGFISHILPLVTTNVDNEIQVVVCESLYYLGEAQFPWAAPHLQYVQIKLESFNTPAAVHELGHHLGLFHTFEGNCNDQGDWVSDTAVARNPSTSCAATNMDSCSSRAGRDDTQNFMNYGLTWSCGLSFTPGQMQRMITTMEYYRPTLLQNTRVSLLPNAFSGRIAGCAHGAKNLSDCWCSEASKDPTNWCRTYAVGGVTYTVGPTPVPATPASSAGRVSFWISKFSCCVLMFVVCFSFFFS